LKKQLAVLVLALASVAARADNVTTYNFTDLTFQDGATGYGTIQIDTTAGTFGYLDLTINDNGTIVNLDELPQVGSQDSYEVNGKWNTYADYPTGLSGAYGGANDPLYDDFVILLPIQSLVNYPGTVLCSVATPCFGPGNGIGLYAPAGTQGDFDLIETGSLTSVTPEPSSFLLAGSGLVAFASRLRRRR
jgi:hypothetical protein